MWKILKGKIIRFDAIIPTNMNHNRNTRNKPHIYSIREKKPIGKLQLKFQLSQTQDKYPEYLRSTKTHSQFKTAFYESKLQSDTTPRFFL